MENFVHVADAGFRFSVQVFVYDNHTYLFSISSERAMNRTTTDTPTFRIVIYRHYHINQYINSTQPTLNIVNYLEI